MSRSRALPWVLFAITACVALWLALPSLALFLAERGLNGLYREYRPSAYRWAAAPNAALALHQIPSGAGASISQLIGYAERRSGRTAQSIRLTGRLEVLNGRLDQALSALRLAHLLEPGDAEILSELGSIYAYRAVAERRAADFAPALDAVVRAAWMAPASSLAAFNAAVVFDEFPLPREAAAQWTEVLRHESDPAWRKEAETRRSHWQDAVEKRDRTAAQFANDPRSIAAAAEPGAAELAVNTAIGQWLRDRPQWRSQIAVLAGVLEEKYHDRWLADLARLPDTPDADRALIALSDAWRANTSGDVVLAAQRAADAEARFHALSNPAGEQRARLEYVAALHRQGQSAACLEVLKGMAQATSARSYPWLHGQAWLDQVTCEGQQRRVDVLPERERAYAWIQTTGYQGLELRSLAFLIEQQVGLGNPLRVWARGREGISNYWKGVLPPLRVHPLYYSLGQSAYSWEYPFAAVSLTRESVRTLEQVGNRQLLGLVLSRLGYYEAATGQRQQAGETYRRAAEQFSNADANQSRVMRDLAEIQTAEGETWTGRPDAAIHRLRALPPFEYGSYAQLFLRPALGNALLGGSQLREAVSEFEQAIAENEQHLKTLNNPIQRESANREMATAYRGLTQARLLSGDTAGALETWENFRTGSAARTPAAGSLAPRTGMLVTAFLPRGLLVWFAGKDGVTYRWVDASQVQVAANRLAEVAADPNVPEKLVSGAASLLARLILQPFEPEIASLDTLLIDPDGPLGRVPWPLLPRSDGERLIERTAVVQIYGRSPALATPVRFDSNLILANPDLGTELAESYPPLLDARREAEWLHGRLPGSLLLIGGDVNLDAVTRLARGRHVVHFAGHGVSYGGFSALLVAGEKGSGRPGLMVTSEQLAAADFSGVDLVFLAACSTGGGESFGSVNPDSLVTSLLHAGASRVVATRWNVGSRPTRRLVETFYESLLTAETPAAALRKAMLTVSREPAFAHSYYWAGFQVFGSP